MEVIKQVDQQRHALRRWPRAAAGVGADSRIGMPEKRCRTIGWKAGTEDGGSGGDLLQTRSLHGPRDEESRHRGGGRTSTDRRERLQCNDLLRHGTVKAESLEPAAERLECRNRRCQFALSCFGRQRKAIRKTCVGESQDKRSVVELSRHHPWTH